MAKCSICSHPERSRIEMLRLAGASLESLSERFALGDTVPAGRDRLWRHMKNHVTQADRAALVADIPLTELADRAAAEGASLLDHLNIIRANLMRLFIVASGAGDTRAAAAVSGRLLEALRDQGQLTGELLRAGPVVNNYTVNLFNSPAFIGLQAMLVERLKHHPEALAEVVRGLRDLEQQQPATIEGTLNDAA